MSRRIWRTISYSFLIIFLHAFIYSSILPFCPLKHFWQYPAVIVLPSFSNRLTEHPTNILSLGDRTCFLLPLLINAESVGFKKVLLLYLLMRISYIPCCCLIIVEQNYFVCSFCSILSLHKISYKSHFIPHGLDSALQSWNRILCSLCSSLWLCMNWPILCYTEMCPSAMFLHLHFIYPLDCSCGVSFHLVPMVSPVRIMNIRDQAEVATGKLPVTNWYLTTSAFVTSIACVVTQVCTQLYGFSRSLGKYLLPHFIYLSIYMYLFLYLAILQWWFSVMVSSNCSEVCFQDRINFFLT